MSYHKLILLTTLVITYNFCFSQNPDPTPPTFYYTYDYDITGNRIGRTFKRLTIPPELRSADTTHSDYLVEDSIENTSLMVFPNPTSEYLFIQIGSSGEVQPSNITAWLYDATGKLIADIPVAIGKSEYNIGNLPAGMYYLHLTVGMTSSHIKIFKQ